MLEEFAAQAATTTGYGRGLRDRERFAPALRLAEEFVRERGLVVGGPGAVLMAVRAGAAAAAPLPLDAFTCVVYSPHPVKDAKALARRIYALDPGGLTEYTGVQARDGGRTASVNAAQREVVRFLGLPVHRGVHIYKMLTPSLRPGLFGDEETPCLDVDVLLCGTYAQLCDPLRRGEWEALLAQERLLRERFLGGAGRPAAIFGAGRGGRSPERGGRSPERGRSPGRASSRSPGRASSRSPERSRSSSPPPPEAPPGAAAFLDRVRRDFAGDPGRVWLTASSRLACVSVHQPAEELETLEALAERAGVAVQFLVNDPQLVIDRRLRRLTAYVAAAGRRRVPVLDVYNLATYEAVPFRPAPAAAVPWGVPASGGRTGAVVNVGTAFLEARFLLVDYWTIHLLWRMDAVSEAYARQQMQALAQSLADLAPALADGDLAFPALPSHYLGRIVSLDLAEKRAMADRGAAFIPPWYVARFAPIE